MKTAGDLTMHSPHRASMAGSVRDVTAHLLDDARPDALSHAEPLAVSQIVQTVTNAPAPTASALSRPAGTLTCLEQCNSILPHSEKHMSSS